MRRFLGALLIVGLSAGALPAAEIDGDRTYELLFRTGTLDGLDREAELLYSREVRNTLKPEAAERDTGDIALTFREGEATMAALEFRQDGRFKALGQFPAGVGNPIIMYFYETVVRDMAEALGGSPFYIRNRVKDALVSPSDMAEGEAVLDDGRKVATRTVSLRPFEDDPNRDQMQGFDDLELRVTMSDAVPGWYLALVAESSGGAVYRSELTFEGLDATP